MPELDFGLVDESSFEQIPAPAQPGARCQTCDYWERLEGSREAPEPGAPSSAARAGLKRQRLLAGRALSGAYAMLARRSGATVAYAQFGPISAYPRAQVIRDRYPELPESPAPWVVTCLQVSATVSDAGERERVGSALLSAVCDELDRRGIIAVEAYPERAGDPWLPSPGPSSVYGAAGFEHVAGEQRYPVYRRELSGETDADAWSGLLQAAKPDEGDDWPLPMPSGPDADDFFRLPPEKPKRPNPFGDD
jgi:hypothetical protein